MLGVDNMITERVDFASYDDPFKPKTKEEIYADLAESMACYERGEYKGIDDALDEICIKYGI